MDELERIQGSVLKAVLNLPVTTPYLGILKETGIWPTKNRIEYNTLMLFQNILTSSKERLGRVILQDQMASTTGAINWYTET